jgi:hypothetical protein
MEAALNYEVKNKVKNNKLYYTEIRNQTNTLKGRKMLPKSIALTLDNGVDRLVHAKKSSFLSFSSLNIQQSNYV